MPLYVATQRTRILNDDRISYREYEEGAIVDLQPPVGRYYQNAVRDGILVALAAVPRDSTLLAGDYVATRAFWMEAQEAHALPRRVERGEMVSIRNEPSRSELAAIQNGWLERRPLVGARLLRAMGATGDPNANEDLARVSFQDYVATRNFELLVDSGLAPNRRISRGDAVHIDVPDRFELAAIQQGWLEPLPVVAPEALERLRQDIERTELAGEQVAFDSLSPAEVAAERERAGIRTSPRSATVNVGSGREAPAVEPRRLEDLGDWTWMSETNHGGVTPKSRANPKARGKKPKRADLLRGDPFADIEEKAEECSFRVEDD